MAYTTINKGSSYFNTKIYTGTGATASITGVGFQPDWVWFKNRSTTNSHSLFDILRGVTKNLITNSTAAESTNTQGLTSFNSDGFTVGNDADVNGSSNNMVAWNWLANGAGVSNTAGSISSTVSANTTAGFSIVSYAGAQGSNFTIGHGLSVTPNIVFAKSRNTADNWGVYYRNNGVNTNFMSLNSTSAQGTNNGSLAGGAYMVMNSTTLQIDSTAFANAGSSMIAYCFAEVKGYSKFGSYTGNGSADGTFVYTGFKPAFVLIKSSSSVENWHIFDDVRNTFNPVDRDLRPNLANAETTSALSNIDFLSNGFKLRNSDADYNGSGTTYIYMAFAENPFVTSGGIPTTAR